MDQVQRRRDREETSGGPPAPHNSVDQSVIVLDETLQEISLDVFGEGEDGGEAVTAAVPAEEEQELIVIGDDTEEEDEGDRSEYG